MKLTDREIVALVDQEFENGLGAPDGEISVERAKAWDYYNSELLGNEVQGRSSVVTSEVSDIVDGIMPTLLNVFATKDNLVVFQPHGPEDVNAAEQETDYVSHVFFNKVEDSFLTLYNWFFDTLVQKNGIVKCWMDESETVTEETYSNLTEQELDVLLQDEELEAVERDETKTVESIQTEVGPIEQEIILHDVRFKRTSTKKRICVENVAPEQFRISNDSRSVNPSKARMVGQECDIKRSDLIAMGFDADVVMSLPASTAYQDSEEKIARRDYDEERETATIDLQEEVTVREAYIYLNESESKVELRQVFVASGKILSNEPADRQPFHILTAKPLPHKHFGRSIAEMVMDIQKVKTTLLRQTLDNLYQSNQPGHYVYEQALGETTMDEFLTTEVGRIVVGDRPPGEAFAPLTTPFTAAQSFSMLEYFDGMAKDRTGYSSEGQNLNPEMLKNIQRGVMSQAIDMSQAKIHTIARIFAETGIKSLFMHIHELVRKHSDAKDVFNLRGQWVQVDPREWRQRDDMTANIGLGLGSRESNMMHLNNIWQKQREMIEGGGLGLTVTPQNIYNTAKEMVKNANLPSADLYFTNPQGQMAPPQNQEQLQLQQQQQQFMMQQQQIEAAKVRIQEMRAMIDKQRADQDAIDDQNQTDIDYEKLNNEITEMELKYGINLPGGV